MTLGRYLVLSAAALAVIGCESGDINLSPTNIDNSTTTGGGGGGGSTNPCAQYTVSGTTNQGTFDGTNCTYSSAFVSLANPLTVSLEIPLISGVHIFQDTLAVGTSVSTGAPPASGTGPTLTIQAGATLAFSDSSDYLVINRGSRIIANGSSTAPITLTGFVDAVTHAAAPEAVQLWGGLVINGNGITNNCTDAQRAANNCHVAAEGGGQTFYGGNDNADNSGVLRYVVTKHTGFEVAPNDELNGVTFNAVGSGTQVSFLETYSAYDDGIEFFGGAVNVDHYIAVYVKDDNIDFSDGYVGTVDTALIIQSQTDGNTCIEGDNIGDTRAAAGVPLGTLPMTNPTIRNMTCITSVNQAGTHGGGEGPTLRRGPQMTLQGSIVYGAFSDDTGADNECFEFAGDNVTNQWAATGATKVINTLIACEQATQPAAGNRLPNGDTENEWIRGANPSTNGANYSFNTGNVIIEAADLFANANLAVLDCFYTRPNKVDNTGAAITFTGPGAVARGATDWTANWTYGLHPNRRAKPLWFATSAASPCGP